MPENSSQTGNAASRRVLILGGGVAGLATAYRLLQLHPRWEVHILEKDDHPGGLAAGWKNERFSADLGPHRIYTELPEIEALLPELIARDQVITVQRRSELLLQGHFYRYPVRALELLSHLGFYRMGVLGTQAVFGKLGGLLSKPRNYRDSMVSAFGRGVYSLIVEPYTRKVWKIAPEDLSEEVARVRVSAGNVNRLVQQLLGNKNQARGSASALNSFSYIKGGVEGLVHSLVEKVRNAGGHLHLSQEVLGFETDSARKITAVTVRGAGDSSPRKETADLVISTLPVTDLVGMLQPVAPNEEARRLVGELVFVGLILVGVVLRRPQMTPNCWIYFPEEKYLFNRSYEPRNFDPGMAPSDRTLGVFEVTSRWDDAPWTWTDDQVVERVRQDLVSTGLVTADEIETAFTVRVPHTYPLYTVPYREHLARIFDYLSGFDNLFSTGRQGLFNHNNMDHSMLMGIRAAEYALHPSAKWYGDLDQFSHFRIVD